MIISRIKAENAESGLATDSRPKEPALVSKMTVGLNRNFHSELNPNDDLEELESDYDKDLDRELEQKKGEVMPDDENQLDISDI